MSERLLQDATALPGTRIRHVHTGWLGTVVSAEWPVLWIHFDKDLERGRQAPRKVWGHIFGVVLPEEEAP